MANTLNIYSDDTKTTLLGTYTVTAGGGNPSITSIASSIGISIPQNADGFYFNGSIYGLNDSIRFPILMDEHDGYFTYPKPSDILKIYNDDTKTTLLGTYEAEGGTSISITSIASDIGISIPQNANGFYYNGTIYGLNDSLAFDGTGDTFDGYFTYPEPSAETISGFYLDGVEYKFGGGGTEYNAGEGISISQGNTISNTGVLSVNGQTGNVTIQTGVNYTAGNGIDITNDEIGLDGTYEGLYSDYSAMQGPAPDGFHVPSRNEWKALIGVLINTFGLAKDPATIGTYLKMPRAGRRDRDSSKADRVNSFACYRSATPLRSENAYFLFGGSSSLNAENQQYRTYGFSIRCFKDSPIVPTSSWTVLYDGSSIATGAGVFYNVSLGLISVSGDGTTWYTIMDKNLGATTVFNQGDTLTDANCGYFYQWGNNYGFAHSGDVTTSSTKVDASNYGPRNYYSSSTFITGAHDWSSVQNDNLWGALGMPTSGNLVLGNKLYKIVTSTTAPASGTANNVITIVID